MNKFYNSNDFAKLIGMSRSTVILWDNLKTLKAAHTKPCGDRRYGVEQYNEFIKLKSELCAKSGKTILSNEEFNNLLLDSSNPVKNFNEGPLWANLSPAGEVLDTQDNFKSLLKFLNLSLENNLMTHKIVWSRKEDDGKLIVCAEKEMYPLLRNTALSFGWTWADKNKYNLFIAREPRKTLPTREWALSVEWDKVSRFNDLFDTLTIDPEYVEYTETMRYQLQQWLIGCGAVLNVDGVSNRNVPTLQGMLILQSNNVDNSDKWFQSLVPNPDWIKLNQKFGSYKSNLYNITTSFICGFDQESMKMKEPGLQSHITNDLDSYRLPYRDQFSSYYRRTTYCHSSLSGKLRINPINNRRYWMMPVLSANANHGLDMQQIFAEACFRAANGEPFWMGDSTQPKSEWALYMKQLELAELVAWSKN